MKKIILLAVFTVVLIAGIATAYSYWKNEKNTIIDTEDIANNLQQSAQTNEKTNEKAYVAIEGAGEIAVIDTQSKAVIKRIDLTDYSRDQAVYMPHNVQVAPNNKSVWVTANAMSAASHNEKQSLLPFIKTARASEGHNEEQTPENDDQLIVIDPETDTIIKRISIGKGLNLAHVVLSPDSSFALTTAQKTGGIYKINAITFEVEKNIAATEGSAPHGLRISPDGKTAYIAMLKGKSLGVLDIGKFVLSYVALDGAAVQTGITPDGKYAVASVYDTKKLAAYNTQNKTLSYVSLPSEAKGPVQMYPTPDSRFVYMVDQGYYFNQPISENVYKIDLAEMKVIKSIKAGKAPHGIVVSKDGKFTYVTNLLSGDVSVIDTATDTEIAKIGVGKQPNGISLWSRQINGTHLFLPVTEFDFGTIKQSGPVATKDFEIKNDGVEDVIIEKVLASCSCTTGKIDKQTIRSGESAILTVSFDPNYHFESYDQIMRTITIYSNAENNPRPEIKIYAKINYDLGVDKTKYGKDND